MNENLKDKIIRVAYNDASIREKVEVFFYIKKNAEARKIFDDYRKTAKAVHAISKNPMPTKVVNKLNKIVIEKIKSDRGSRKFTSPVFALTLSVLLIAIFTFTFLKKNTNYYDGYDQATVETASEQTLASLKMVAQIFSQTKKIVIGEVLIKKVSKPIHNGFTKVEKILK